ncbi:Arc family DNA-binding protein [Comamonas odontotermitis]|uniref:Arc family DNA-binding protein n=1 Tax=Comamonas odontotermitis TaxID=379895 RepID=UPI00366FC9DA
MEPKQQPPYPLRMSPELRTRLESEAELARRSLNAEIVDRLESSISGQASQGIGSRSLEVALARAEQNAAMAEVQAEGRLFAAAMVSRALLDTMVELDRRGIKLEMPVDVINESYATAYQFVRDADHRASSGGLDAVIARAEQTEKRLQDAQAALRAAAAHTARSTDISPERTLKFKGSSGIARKIAVTTKTTRKVQP